MQKDSAVATICKAWFAAGTLDILAAFTQFYLRSGKNPLVILKYVASGAYGPAAIQGGAEMEWMGLLFHYLIALGATLFFFWIYPNAAFLRINKWITAILYGLFTWVVTNLAIVPLSRIHKFPSDPGQAVIGALILIVMIGLPLSFIIGGYYDRRTKASTSAVPVQ